VADLLRRSFILSLSNLPSSLSRRSMLLVMLACLFPSHIATIAPTAVIIAAQADISTQSIVSAKRASGG